MQIHRILAVTAFVAAVASSQLLAADVEPTMTERGKLLFSDDLQTKYDAKQWHGAKGKWEIVDGALKGIELKSDMHGAVTRHTMPFKNVIVQYEFQLNGSRTTTFSINDKEHLCRVLINKDGFTAQKDDRDHEGPDKAVVFEKKSLSIKPGQWYTLTIEISGKEMLARIGDQIAYGSHDRIADDKANFGFTVAGESASFRNFRMWEALPKKDWDKSKLASLKK